MVVIVFDNNCDIMTLQKLLAYIITGLDDFNFLQCFLIYFELNLMSSTSIMLVVILLENDSLFKDIEEMLLSV